MSSTFDVDLPAGGRLVLNTADEVEAWNAAAKAYIEDFGLNKAVDLTLLGALLSLNLAMYRAQQDLGDPKKAAGAQTQIGKIAEQIRELQKALGIDKKSREAGGQHTVQDYIDNLKAAAHEKGIHIAQRTKAFEALAMEARWKVRLLRNGDAEDRAYHDISEKSIIDWLERELDKLEEADKTWAKTKGKVFVGKL